MGKSSPAGNTTVTQVNPSQQAQQPFLTDLYGQALQQFQQLSGNPYVQQIQSYANQQGQTAAPAVSGLPVQAGNQLGAILAGGQPNQNWMTGLSGLAGALTRNVNAPTNWQSSLGNIGTLASQLGPQAVGALNPYTQALMGTGGALTGVANQMPAAVSPYTSGMQGLAGQATSVANPSINSLLANAGMAITGNPAIDSLMGQANGAFLGPNPALNAAISAAQQPTALNYMTATAPQTASNFESAGRYGSGVSANAQGVNQYGLATGLGNIASQMSNQGYLAGLQNMLGAGQSLGQIYNTGISNSNQALTNAGTLGQQGIQLGGNLLNQAGTLNLNALTGEANALTQGGNAFGTAGQLTNQGYSNLGNFLNTGANAYSQAGNQGLQNAQTLGGLYGTGGNLTTQGLSSLMGGINAATGLAGYPTAEYGQALNAPWLPLQAYSGILGNPQQGSSTTTQPYFSNPTANALGTGLGGLALYNGLNTAAGGGLSSALGGLFGSGGAGAAMSYGTDALMAGGAGAGWGSAALMSLI